MITIIADEGNGRIGAELHQEFIAKGVPAEYISLDGVTVKPCTGCGACTSKTYGRCATRDDADWLLPKVVQSDTLIFVSPITFGSYSFRVKRVFDKFGLFMDAHYFIDDGELVKGGKKGTRFRYFAVGFSDDCGGDEIRTFETLFRENIKITRGIGKSFITGVELSQKEKNQITEEVLRV